MTGINEVFYPNAEHATARDNPANAEFFAAMDKLSDALVLLAKLDTDEQMEVWSNTATGDELTPALVAQVLMYTLPFEGKFPIEAKKFWLDVACLMGPDWIPQLRMVAAFMNRVENFK